MLDLLSATDDESDVPSKYRAFSKTKMCYILYDFYLQIKARHKLYLREKLIKGKSVNYKMV
jgi:hypothetical protein